jgi:dephospho-CoA kinase
MSAWKLPPRIALGGLMGSGKTTIAAHLAETQGYTPLAFADEIRGWLQGPYGTVEKGTYYAITSATGEHTLATGRELLQRVGAAARAIDLDIIVRAMRAQVGALIRESDDAKIVVHDLRTEREAHALAALGFAIVNLEAPANVRRERVGKAWSDRPDLTEQPLVGYPSIRTDGRTPVQIVEAIEAKLKGTTWAR